MTTETTTEDKTVMITINVLFFAAARERVGYAQEQRDLPSSSTITDLKRLLYRQHPSLESLDLYLRWAVNHEFISGDERLLKAGDEVALIPPISGG